MSLLFMAAVAFGVALLALSGQRAALANSTGQLIPTGQGYYSAWTPSSGSSEVDAIDDGTCGTGDGMWITGSYATPNTSFTLNLSSMPSDANMQSIDVTFCYSDADSTDLLQTVTPFIRRSNTDFPGTGIDPKGSTAIASVTQHWELGGAQPINGLEIGLKDVGFIGRVKIWAVWAVITWNPPPTPVPPPTVSTSVSIIPPGVPFFNIGQIVEWQTDVTVSAGNPYLLEFMQTWDGLAFLLLPPATGTLLGSGQSLPCTTTNNTFNCSFGLGGGTYRFNLRAVVGDYVCSSPSNITVKLKQPPFTTLGQAVSTVSLNGGCATPTPTATATSASTSTPTPTGTGTSATASPTATGTSGLPTSTPTSMGGATSTATGTGTPGGTTTATPTPTPTVPPLSARPFRLREVQIARDGVN